MFLTINGPEYLVIEASEEEPVRIGGITRTFSGKSRSSIRAEKRVRSFGLLDMSKASLGTLLGVIALGAVVTVGGDAFPSPIQARVTYKGSKYVRDGTSFLLTPVIEVAEV